MVILSRISRREPSRKCRKVSVGPIVLTHSIGQTWRRVSLLCTFFRCNSSTWEWTSRGLTARTSPNMVLRSCTPRTRRTSCSRWDPCGLTWATFYRGLTQALTVRSLVSPETASRLLRVRWAIRRPLSRGSFWILLVRTRCKWVSILFWVNFWTRVTVQSREPTSRGKSALYLTCSLKFKF